MNVPPFVNIPFRASIEFVEMNVYIFVFSVYQQIPPPLNLFLSGKFCVFNKPLLKGNALRKRSTENYFQLLSQGYQINVSGGHGRVARRGEAVLHRPVGEPQRLLLFHSCYLVLATNTCVS